MYIIRSVLIFSLCLIAPIQKKDAIKTSVVSHVFAETLKGHVKRLIEIRPDFHTEPQLCPIDTTDFSKNGNPIETRLGTGLPGRTCVVTKYINHYNKWGRKVETIALPDDNSIDGKIYHYDTNGNVITSGLRPKKGKSSNNTLYKYDIKGNLVKTITYLGSNQIFFKVEFKYNSENRLMEEDFYKGGTRLVGKLFYEYIQFDKMGNWLKRIENHGHGEKFNITRKITYY